ncbi:hypothetical protein [Sulfurospirillum deleyianum]|uniref:Uncharacterized protein n=1 Tax=Sulfurospirillum deleyianum (strain ATCC 51133 / DSM 6946 / 5175) TaxID=525898 RepID=D1B2A9_SULD5|nr:hypothetical protein [Sulfurospirillum deleyianum]ACZ12229.1 hypothetical protein Sdel_1206 [Sulfurospirillum deleyianum DSM 6946]
MKLSNQIFTCKVKNFKSSFVPVYLNGTWLKRFFSTKLMDYVARKSSD